MMVKFQNIVILMHRVHVFRRIAGLFSCAVTSTQDKIFFETQSTFVVSIFQMSMIWGIIIIELIIAFFLRGFRHQVAGYPAQQNVSNISIMSYKDRMVRYV